MAAIDGILSLMLANGADELRLVEGEAPKMFARGAQKRLSLPLTTRDLLAHLLEPLVDEGARAKLAEAARVEVGYRPEHGSEQFRVTLVRHDGEPARVREAVFLRGPAPAPAATAASKAPATTTAPTLSAPPQPIAPPPLRALPPEPIGPIATPAMHGQALQPSLRALLAEARQRRASDLHLVDGGEPTLRIDRRLRRLDDAPIASVAELFADLDADELRAAATGERALDTILESDGARFRVNVYRCAAGLAAAIRVLPREAPELHALNLRAPIADLALLPHGLVLVCGPTGSGKSATLAALAQQAVRQRGCLLVTLEDPIEYVIDPGSAGLVRQRSVGRDVRDFPTGLRDALREDPDVLLVGEMRDPETIALALSAAETGHLVLATLHSRSAASAVERIVDAAGARAGDEVRRQLAASLRAVVAQRLIARASGTGVAAAVEVLRNNLNVASLIREGKIAQIHSALQSSRREGMVALEAAPAELVRPGATARGDAEAECDPVALANYLAG